MNNDTNISGISENLANSIAEQSTVEEHAIGLTFLHEKKIAISVSESEELEFLGLSTHHLNDISIEIARYLIVNGATMLYGGDLRQGGFTDLFSELSYQYKYLGDKQCRFVNYFPFPTSEKLTIDDKVNFIKKQIDPRILEIPQHLGDVDKEKPYDPFSSLEDRFVFSECFSDMRIKMANDSDARILLGGKQKNYLGYIPGIVEEAYQSLVAKKPIYLLGGFGGATKSIIKCIKGENPKELTNEFHFDTDFLNNFKNYSSDLSALNYDFDFLTDFFQQYNVDVLSKNNGLSIEENEILFESTNIHELVFLIIKGLQNISK